MNDDRLYDYIVIGSGFGGSISAMRLVEKGYRVLVLEQGRRFDDDDFAESDWNLRRHQWMPAVRCFGIWHNTLLNGIMVLHGCGVGGGSLVYANVLMEPDDQLFAAPAWKHLADWKTMLRPHYASAKRMLGVTPNPKLWPADHALKAVADELGAGRGFGPTEVGVYFNEDQPGEPVPDPYFNGEGPQRCGCTHCGACMVGCRQNAKNTLVKNYLYFAEKWGARVLPEATVRHLRPLPAGRPDRARYEIGFFKTTGGSRRIVKRVRSRNVIVSAGAVGTNRLLFLWKEKFRTLPLISSRLGTNVRTNSESLTGITTRDSRTDFSKGVAIGSIFSVDDITRIEAVRFPEGSSATLMLLGAPMVRDGLGRAQRLTHTFGCILKHPVDFLYSKFLPGLSRRTVILLTMQTRDNLMRLRLGRSPLTLFRKGLVCEHDAEKTILADVAAANRVTRMLARRSGAIAQAMVNQGLLNLPSTAHFMGGVPFGLTDDEGVIDLNCEVHNYPGLFVVDGSIMPANPGVNPSLTIAALAEYAMTHIPPKPGGLARPPLMVPPPMMR